MALAVVQRSLSPEVWTWRVEDKEGKEATRAEWGRDEAQNWYFLFVVGGNEEAGCHRTHSYGTEAVDT